MSDVIKGALIIGICIFLSTLGFAWFANRTIVGRYERHRHYIFDNVTGSEYHFGANQYGSFSKRWELGWDGHYHEKKSTTGDYYYSPMSEEELKENKARQKKLDQQENARQQKIDSTGKDKRFESNSPGGIPGAARRGCCFRRPKKRFTWQDQVPTLPSRGKGTQWGWYF